jgi:putative transposase
MQYRRALQKGGTYFFTLVTYKRKNLFTSPAHLGALNSAFKKVLNARRFRLDAFVILPDHIHVIVTLPKDDNDYSTRIRLLKTHFTVNSNRISQTQLKPPVWQPRYWEHVIRNETDFENHANYIHYNPVKHGYVSQPRDWKHSSFHSFVRKGFYPPDWGHGVVNLLDSVGSE